MYFGKRGLETEIHCKTAACGASLNLVWTGGGRDVEELRLYELFLSEPTQLLRQRLLPEIRFGG